MPLRLAGLRVAEDPLAYKRVNQLLNGKVAYVRALGPAFRPSSFQSDEPPPQDCVVWKEFRGAHFGLGRCINGRMIFEGIATTTGVGVPGLDGLEKYYPRLLKRLHTWEALARTFRVGLWERAPYTMSSRVVSVLVTIVRGIATVVHKARSLVFQRSARSSNPLSRPSGVAFPSSAPVPPSTSSSPRSPSPNDILP